MVTETYPQTPGWKTDSTETSRQAARAVAPEAKQLQQRVAEAYRGAAMTHDECAELLRPADMGDVAFETFKRSVRSRSSELKAQGRIKATAKRQCNASGHSAVVWRAVRTAVQEEMFA